MELNSWSQENWEKYKRHLKKSTEGVWVVAKYLNNLGYDTKVNATKIAPTRKEYFDYVDKGDIEISGKCSPRIIEVKNVSLKFTSHQDFPYETFIVCAKKAYDRHDKKPYAYVIVNNDKTHAITVSTDTYDKWEVKEFKDKRYENYKQLFYVSRPMYHQIIKINDY